MRLSADVLTTQLHMDLYEAGWQNAGDYPGISQRQVAMNSLAGSFLKKFHNDETDKARDDKALQLFLACNERCKNFPGVLPRSLKEELIIGETKSILYDFFNPEFLGQDGLPFREPLLLNLSDIATCFGLGNGSNIGSSSTDFYTKLVNSTMSHTNPALPYLFRQAISSDRLWTDVEAFRSQRYDTEVVCGSRLSFVPKSRVISRTICTEPVLNMLFQKGIAGVLERRLRQVFHIDLSVQPHINSAMARSGSISGKFGTIDLSSASDTISMKMLAQLLPSEPLDWLVRCRSPLTTLPSGVNVELHMISSMGNGYTFPLQTILFACLVAAVYRVFGIRLEYPVKLNTGKYQHGNFAVFGDDIIVDSRVYDTVADCLGLLGFSVNRDKSFNKGFFRESCGSDYFSGYNVRGVYLRKLLTPGDFYSAINRLNHWSATHGILLSRTVGRLRSGCRFRGVPFDEADDAGIKIPVSLLRTVRRDITGAIRYTALVNLARTVCIPSVDSDLMVDPKEVEKVRVLLPHFTYSPDGLLFCLLAGWLRNGQLGYRTLHPRAVLRHRVCPGWDERIAARGVSPEFRDRWKWVVEANLVS